MTVYKIETTLNYNRSWNHIKSTNSMGFRIPYLGQKLVYEHDQR